ncbi:MAG: ABC transporter permease [Candidatus Nanohaloarchaea archaeon]
MFLDFFRLSLNSLRHRKRRSWLTIIGTLIGIMAVVSLISIGQGLENSIKSELRELGGNKVFVSPGGGISGRFSDTTFKLTEEDLETVERSRSVATAAGMISGNVQAEFRRDNKFIKVIGLPAGTKRDTAKEIFGIEMEEGRYIRQNDRTSVIVEKDIADDKFEDEMLLRSNVGLEDEYRIVGIYTSSGAVSGASGIIMPMERAREVLDKKDEYGMITAQIRQGFTPEEAADEIRRNLRNERGVKKGSENFKVRTAKDILRSFRNQLSIVRGVLLGIGAISLLVGGIGIMNTMYTSVTERTKQIGVMKAVGATRRQILGLFMIESGIVGMIGGLIGATVGIGLSYVAGIIIRSQVSLPFTPYVSVELIIGSVLFSFLVGVVSGTLPARKAAKKEPVEALRFG